MKEQDKNQKDQETKMQNPKSNDGIKDQEMMDKLMEEKVKKSAEEVHVPTSLKPESVEKMLDEKKAKKARNRRWKYASVAAAACVCLVVGTVGAMNAWKGNEPQVVTKEKDSEQQQPGKIASAKDYEEIRTYLQANEERMQSSHREIGLYSAEKEAGMEDSAGASNANFGGNYSDTNVRQEGVGEADTVKTDGKNLYLLNDQTVEIVDASQAEMKELSSITMEPDRYIREIFVSEGRLVILYTESKYDETDANANGLYQDYTCAAVYDVTDPADPKETGTVSQSGQYHTMRVKDGYVYLISDYYTYYDAASGGDASQYIPQAQGDLLRAEDIYMPQGTTGQQYTVISAFAISDPTEKLDTKAVFGGAGMCYVSEENIYITELYYGESESENVQTSIRKLSYADGTLEAVAQTKIDGTLDDSFSIDEYEGYLRIVATVTPNNYNNGIMPILYGRTAEDVSADPTAKVEEDAVSTNSLYVLDENLEMTGSIQNLAPDESIYSARFMGNTGYFVTFRQIDPLFSVDLSDPAAPKIIGELKIPGFSDYLHPYGEGRLLGIGMSVDEDGMTTEGVKLSMFDITDPANVKETHTYVLQNVLSTDAGYNYKAVFADAEKNLFGFAAYGDSIEYKMFTYDETEGFKEVFSKNIINYGNVRGLYIGETFYLVAGNTVESFTMNGFEKIDDIVL